MTLFGNRITADVTSKDALVEQSKTEQYDSYKRDTEKYHMIEGRGDWSDCNYKLKRKKSQHMVTIRG